MCLCTLQTQRVGKLRKRLDLLEVDPESICIVPGCEEVGGRFEFSLRLLSSGKTVRFQAESEQERRQWVLALHEACRSRQRSVRCAETPLTSEAVGWSPVFVCFSSSSGSVLFSGVLWKFMHRHRFSSPLSTGEGQGSGEQQMWEAMHRALAGVGTTLLAPSHNEFVPARDRSGRFVLVVFLHISCGCLL